MPVDDPRRELLQRQLAIMWRFAEEFVIGRLNEDQTLWQPSDGACTVHLRDGGWCADWPDEHRTPPPTVTIAWILWHIEWWWNDTLSRIDDTGPIAASAFPWSGGTHGISTVKQRWDDLLATAHLGHTIEWVLPEPQPLWFIASWVNTELTKNLAEINLLTTLHAHENSSSRHRIG